MPWEQRVEGRLKVRVARAVLKSTAKLPLSFSQSQNCGINGMAPRRHLRSKKTHHKHCQLAPCNKQLTKETQTWLLLLGNESLSPLWLKVCAFMKQTGQNGGSIPYIRVKSVTNQFGWTSQGWQLRFGNYPPWQFVSLPVCHPSRLPCPPASVCI